MPLETDISSQKCRSASLQCIIKSICYFITCRQMTNKMSSFFHPFLFDWHRTASAEFVVVSHWSFVFVLKMAQSLKRQKPTERKLNYFPYFFLFCFAIRWRAVVTLFFFSGAAIGCRCQLSLLLLHERLHRIPCYNFLCFVWMGNFTFLLPSNQLSCFVSLVPFILFSAVALFHRHSTVFVWHLLQLLWISFTIFLNTILQSNHVEHTSEWIAWIV